MFQLVALLSCVGVIFAKAGPLNLAVHNERLSEKIVGGNDAPRNAWPWQASLQYDSYNSGDFYHICGGVVVEALYIMTAAHCILSMSSSQFRVVLGEHNLYEYDGSEQIGLVEKIIIHPGWTGDLGNGNDIALLRLSESIYDNGYVKIADLPYPDETLPHDFDCVISGWGLLYTGGSVPAILQEATINVVEHSVCSSPAWWGSYAKETMVCVGGRGTEAGCQGDSGGPVNCYTDGAWRVHGVASFVSAYSCSEVYKPTVYTRVSSFIDWIHSVTRDQ